jgi:N-acetylmuramoyl-L-alanine amidase/Mannosyl-glycoprotein endo-beta-N-acetylglucosaminidase
MFNKEFKELVSTYLESSVEFPQLIPITLAQWTLESGYGHSELARKYHNFAGLKWRDEMRGYATPVEYAAHDGTEEYCAFSNYSSFIFGYWRFLDRTPYIGWRAHSSSGESFIRFIAPIYTPTQLYAQSVIQLLPQVVELIKSVDHRPIDAVSKPPGTSEEPKKPSIKRFLQSPHFSSRNGERIRRIIMHCTTSRNLEGAISWFLDPISKVSAHYVIGRDGSIIQMVRDADKAWHARNANADSIGIEHCAGPDDEMTKAQRDSSVSLVKWLLSEYKLSSKSIFGHRFTPENVGHTSCPDHVFGDSTDSAIATWIQHYIE